jgi:hypothetical protein
MTSKRGIKRFFYIGFFLGISISNLDAQCSLNEQRMEFSNELQLELDNQTGGFDSSNYLEVIRFRIKSGSNKSITQVRKYKVSADGSFEAEFSSKGKMKKKVSLINVNSLIGSIENLEKNDFVYLCPDLDSGHYIEIILVQYLGKDYFTLANFHNSSFVSRKDIDRLILELNRIDNL